MNNCRREAPIDRLPDFLPDNVFLEIFNFCLQDSDPTKPPLERTKQWQRLARVCQRWRKIVFGSSHAPRRLDLRLSCSYRTPVRKNLVFWPDNLPLTVDYPGGRYPYGASLTPNDETNILFALQNPRRVHSIKILATTSLLRKMAAILQKSFPVLTHLDLTWDLNDFPESDSKLPVIPERFLGGSAPRLQHLCLSDIAFLQLPTFLLSARNLVTLKLKQIPPNGYISPEAMVGGLAVLTRLTTLSISLGQDTTPFHPKGTHPAPLVPRFSNVVYLSASGDKVRSKGRDSTKWLSFFRLFPAVEFLDLSGGVAVYIASTLVDAAKMVTDVFPVLHSIGLDKGEGEVEEGCKKTV